MRELLPTSFTIYCNHDAAFSISMLCERNGWLCELETSFYQVQYPLGTSTPDFSDSNIIRKHCTILNTFQEVIVGHIERPETNLEIQRQTGC